MATHHIQATMKVKLHSDCASCFATWFFLSQLMLYMQLVLQIRQCSWTINSVKSIPNETNGTSQSKKNHIQSDTSTNHRGLASQKQCTQALSLISLNTLNAFLQNFHIIPFSHHALLDTHNPPLLICTPPFSHHHGVPKCTHFTHMTLNLAQK